MVVARRFVVSGRVQGVGFRYFTQEWALREGATGWVRNLPDGRVEAHVEGEAEAVTRVERALRSGPRGARVEKVIVDVEDVSGAYETFTVTSYGGHSLRGT
jgi:acylphosphatase